MGISLGLGLICGYARGSGKPSARARFMTTDRYRVTFRARVSIRVRV
jgi:hypothetical protein